MARRSLSPKILRILVAAVGDPDTQCLRGFKSIPKRFTKRLVTVLAIRQNVECSAKRPCQAHEAVRKKPGMLAPTLQASTLTLFNGFEATGILPVQPLSCTSRHSYHAMCDKRQETRRQAGHLEMTYTSLHSILRSGLELRSRPKPAFRSANRK